MTARGDLEHQKYVGQVLASMRILTSNDGDLTSHFDRIDEIETKLSNTSKNHPLFNNRDTAANKGNRKSQIPVDPIFGFGKLSEKLPHN